MLGVEATLLLNEVCASLQYQREAVTHLGVAGGVGGVHTFHNTESFVHSINHLLTCSLC